MRQLSLANASSTIPMTRLSFYDVAYIALAYLGNKITA